MSPEQRNPARTDIDTRTDVFSLGVILRELLAGVRPDAAPPTQDSASACLNRLPPALLGELAALRGLRPQEFIATLRGDLDAIIAKATAIDREARYESVDALATDLRRHLEGWPIRARPRHPRYVAGKFFRRNRVACSFAAVTALVVVLSAVGSFVSYLREHEALRREVEARAVTERLLQASRYRDAVAGAVTFLEWGRVKEADDVLREHPLSGVERSRDSAPLFRTLGRLNAEIGRWKQAAECFSYLAQANLSENPELVARHWDFLFSFPAFLEAGDTAAYESLRNDVLSRAAPIRDTVAAEHVLKTCLLRPAKPGDLERMRPLALLVENELRAPERPADIQYYAWRGLAMALFEYRMGRDEAALAWIREYTPSSSNIPVRLPPQIATMRWIESMACRRLGRLDRAESAAGEARDITVAHGGYAVIERHWEYNELQGTWPDWAVARIMQREAEATAEKKPSDAGLRAPAP